jgi:hypothetical protein
MTWEHHVIDLNPPNERNPFWRAECSKHDFSQTYINRVSAYEAGQDHIKECMLVNELRQGTYQFDDGSA